MIAIAAALMTGWLPILAIASSTLSGVGLLIMAFRFWRNKRLKAALTKLASDIAERDQSLLDSQTEAGKLKDELFKVSSNLDTKDHEYSVVSGFLKTCESERDEGWAKFTSLIHKIQSLNAENAALKLESNKRALITETLSKCVKMIEEHATTLQQLGQPLVEKGYCEAWLNSVEYSINSLLGPDAVKAFYDGSDTGKPLPETLEAQAKWISGYSSKLNVIISEQLYPTESDPVSREDEAMLQKAEDSARAWAEKQQRNKAK